ncbi:uncharacterized protein PG986_011474 [Apiospora aurea]|uniref:Uncharacterized protein n=1 Tax=Apiospora aurea TaxID=335848 RepID=A0ABR1Q6I1_9PEZI
MSTLPYPFLRISLHAFSKLFTAKASGTVTIVTHMDTSQLGNIQMDEMNNHTQALRKEFENAYELVTTEMQQGTSLGDIEFMEPAVDTSSLRGPFAALGNPDLRNLADS